MRPMIRRAAAFVALAVVALSAAAGAGPAKGIAWQKDFKKALSTAKKQKKIMMVDFGFVG